MSTPFGDNPYAPPKDFGPNPQGWAPGPAGPFRYQYLRAMQYVFDSPNGMNNLLFCGLCALIPVIGSLMVLGYMCLVMEDLIASQGTRYRDFEFGKLGDYLGRCLHPFLVSLVGSLALAVVIFVVYGAGMLIIAAAAGAGENAGGVVALIVMPILFITVLTLQILGQGIITPMCIRAALTQDIGEGFRIAWAWDFFQRTKLEMILTAFFLFLSAVAAEIVGLLMCCVGILFTMMIVAYGQAFFAYQLYQLYLSRGGEPVQIKAHSYK